MSKRELDLGRLMSKVGRRMEDEGQATSQKLHDWKRIEKVQSNTRGTCEGCGGEGYIYADADQVECDICKGTGDCGVRMLDPIDRRRDRQASRLAAEWIRTRLQLENLTKRAEWIMDQAKAETPPLDKHRTPAQVEALGWCGAHWHATRALVAVTKRPSGEPYYKGRCRFCGSWPGGDPPVDVLRTRSQQAAAS